MASLLPIRLARFRLSSVTPATAGWQSSRRALSDGVVTKDKILAIRKATGLGLDKCRKALLEKNGSVEEAITWVRDQAREKGWQAMQVRGDQQTSHGLLGLCLERSQGRSLAAVLELNCETDFVARTDDFRALLSNMTESVFQHGKNSELSSSSNQFHLKTLDGDQLKELPGSGSRSVGEDLAEAVGRVGERLSLRRGVLLSAPYLGSYVHSAAGSTTSPSSPVLAGSYCALAEVQPRDDVTDMEKVSTQLCQHIVGLGVTSPHVLDVTGPQQRPFDTETMKKTNAELLSQAFVMDESLTVDGVLNNAKIDLGYFHRFVLGQ